MPRIAIYARFSTDKQDRTSVDDQINLCRRRAESFDDARVTGIFKDEAVSGSTPVEHRLGGAAMMQAARNGEFDILILEGLDRLARNLVDQEQVMKYFDWQRIRVLGVIDGSDSENKQAKMTRQMRGAFNEQYIDDVRDKTRRGLSGQVSRGYVVTGRAYGYDLQRDDHGTKYVINENEAKWVRWIFERFADGDSPRVIAAELNRLSVPSPRGGTWMQSGIYGSPAKGAGILNNSSYIGEYIWNRSSCEKNPMTQKKERRDRPESEWMRVARPEYRIVSDELWQRAHARYKKAKYLGGTKGNGPYARTLFGGLLRCPHCDGAVVAIDARSYGCLTRKERGNIVCPGILVSRKHVDENLLHALQTLLLDNGGEDEINGYINEILATHAEHKREGKDEIRQRLAKIEHDLPKLIDAITSTGNRVEYIVAKIDALSAEQKELKAALAHVESEAVKWENYAPLIRAKMAELRETLRNTSADNAMRAREKIAAMLGPITLYEGEGGVYGRCFDPLQQVALNVIGEAQIFLVAGAGLEPATFGL
ncbi:recombinase family protein [Cupriavidus taiwanensis]|uniref:recombinase family protein n=1 Tax=Cupriavidus taiwanensis TaxID=164546 RepID=UPI000E1600F0|nr:Recombinase [Cupriavidus taiwanensis]